MKKIGIVKNVKKADSDRIEARLLDMLAKTALSVQTMEDAAQADADCDCLLVLGGDGTLLRAAKKVVDPGIPLLGCNTGTLGYLAEVDENTLEHAVEKVIAGEYGMEERTMLEGTVLRDGEEIFKDIALNDVVLARQGPLRVVLFRNYVNGAFLNAYRGDGMIFSTATGSTGYSLSVGGPIIAPTADILLMTPIAPHTLISRSIVLPGEATLRIELGSGTTEENAEALVSFDGGNEMPLRTRDAVVVRRSSKKTKLIKINDTSFLQVLREKMAGA